jgi:hypothetical protein
LPAGVKSVRPVFYAEPSPYFVFLRTRAARVGAEHIGTRNRKRNFIAACEKVFGMKNRRFAAVGKFLFGRAS